jgi:hypothetical protein
MDVLKYFTVEDGRAAFYNAKENAIAFNGKVN